VIEAALGWIGDVAQFVGSLVPRLLVVQTSHRAVKYVRGAVEVELQPGLHVYWPLVTPVETCAVVRQTLDIPARLLETADGETVVGSGVVEYEIKDPILFLARTENGYDSIRLVAGAAIRRVVLESTREELRGQEELSRRLLVNDVQEALEPYGVLVLTARLADFARVRAIHLTGGHTSDGRFRGELIE
jgi:regulator of protease activity HflC (stomatin/prohibitin superfamily)